MLAVVDFSLGQLLLMPLHNLLGTGVTYHLHLDLLRHLGLVLSVLASCVHAGDLLLIHPQPFEVPAETFLTSFVGLLCDEGVVTVNVISQLKQAHWPVLFFDFA